MSQVDRIHFMSTLFWVMFLFIIWYFVIFVFIFPFYYKTLRSRVEYENLIVINYILIKRLVKINNYYNIEYEIIGVWMPFYISFLNK